MKSLSYILLAFLLIATYGCKEEEHPYVGYITVGRVVVDAVAGSATATAETDLSEPITVQVKGNAAEWCSASVNGKQITVTFQANTNTENFRTATVSVRCGYRVTEFTVLQKFEGQQYLEYDWKGWSATCSHSQAEDMGASGNDGTITADLFNEDRTKYWHSQYSPVIAPTPQSITVDLKKELLVSLVRVAWRYYDKNGEIVPGVNYATVKTMKIYTSTDGQNFTEVGIISKNLPWTAPDGTIVTGTSHALLPAYDDVILPEPTSARYVKLEVTETNMTNGACQVAYFKAFEKI